jgi:hypothetical protein
MHLIASDCRAAANEAMGHKLPNAARQTGPAAILQKPIRHELMLASLAAA